MRSQRLDFLRALAVFLVLGHHLAVCPAELNYPLHIFTFVWQRGGWIGVDIFFVLSGFLISGLLFKELLRTGSVSPGRFLIRRGFKIYPAFYVLILATVIFIPGRVTAPRLLAEIFFVQNYFPGIYTHTWSLAVEEHFYLLLALSFGFIPLVRKRIPELFVAIAVLSLALRFYLAYKFPFDGFRNQFNTHIRLDSLMFGVLLAYLKYFRPEIFGRLTRRWLLLPGVVALIPTFIYLYWSTPFMYTVGLTLNYLGAGMILLGMIGAGPLPDFLGRPVAFLGARSYSLYLWHLPVLYLASRISNWYLQSLAYLAGAVAVGLVMNLLVETPMLIVRDRIFPPAGPVASITGQEGFRGSSIPVDPRLPIGADAEGLGQ